jgi:endonuclease/exonuclease/phosphatase family metal-dependent hydrolase
VDIQAAPNSTFTVIVAHLKSKLPSPESDEAEERLGEARVLRGIIDARLAREPDAKFVVLGDFNDTRDSAPIREIIGRGKRKLFDTRPAERNGDTIHAEPPYYEPRNVSWTYFYGKDDEYSRIDYILLSPALKRNWLANETYAPAISNWGMASDHRPITAGFTTDGN